MMITLALLVLAGLTLLAVSLQRTYSNLPIKELKHRAHAGDPVAVTLLRAATYGSSLKAVLWLFTVLVAASFFYVMANATASWFAIMVSAGLLWLGFVWLPAQEVTTMSLRLARLAAPVFEKVLPRISPILERINVFIRRHRPVVVHTGLYDVTDLQQLFERQKVQSDNRINIATLDLVRQGLTFGDKTVADILVPNRVVRSVVETDSVGPVLMDDLHKSGFSRFPVYTNDRTKIVGILYLRSLVSVKHGGTVASRMSKTVCYVHENQPLFEALQAIITTHQQLFVVVNSFEEYVGIVTLEDILEQIVGRHIVDEFDQYDDMRAVAAKLAAKDHQVNHKHTTPK